jgi:hypothetical protein
MDDNTYSGWMEYTGCKDDEKGKGKGKGKGNRQKTKIKTKDKGQKT